MARAKTKPLSLELNPSRGELSSEALLQYHNSPLYNSDFKIGVPCSTFKFKNTPGQIVFPNLSLRFSKTKKSAESFENDFLLKNMCILSII